MMMSQNDLKENGVYQYPILLYILIKWVCKYVGYILSHLVTKQLVNEEECIRILIE